MAKQFLVAGVGLVDPKKYAMPDRAVRVLRAYSQFSVGTVIPNMPAAEREARIRQHQVEPAKPVRKAKARAQPAPAPAPVPAPAEAGDSVSPAAELAGQAG